MSHKFQELLGNNVYLVYRCLNVIIIIIISFIIIIIIVIILFNKFVSYALHVIFPWNA